MTTFFWNQLKDNFLTDEIKHNMTVSAYGELMVMRWVNAGNDFTIRLPQSRSSFIHSIILVKVTTGGGPSYRTLFLWERP